MKKVLFNGLLYSKFGAGISNYAKNLVDNMIDKDNITFMLSKEVEDKYKDYKNIKIINGINSSKNRIMYEQIKALNIYKENDIVHFPDYATPIFSKSKKVATIHDMAFFTVQECYTKGQVATKKLLLDKTVKNADKLICISKFTYNELKNYYPNLDDDKVEIIYNGFNRSLRKYNNISLSKFKID
uniref:glycosyltransferase n=1 Tax=Faecalimicrobium dakarense TaxID=1301100 RepID=UPI0005A65E7D